VTTTQRQHIALEVTVTLAGGATQTHYFATEGFRSGPADAPAGTYFAELVESVGEYRRELFGGARVAGAVKASRGSITLINAGGVLDNFAAAGAGGLVVARIGTPGAQYPAEYETLFRSYIDTVAADFQSVRLTLRDRVEQLDAPIVTAIFQGSGGLEGTVGAAGKKQLVFGAPGLVPPILLDPLRQIYYVQANATDINTVTGVAEFGQMFEGGYPIARGAHYTLAAELLADDGPDPGTCRMWSGYAGDLDVNGITYGSVSAGASYTKGPIYVRLGTPPVFELRFGASGYLQNSSSDPPREWRFSDLCNRAGMGDVEPVTMAPVAGVLEDFDCGARLIDADQSFAQVMDDRAAALLGTYGFDALDRFFCARLQGAEEGDDQPLLELTESNASACARTPVPGMEHPVWQVSVRAGRAHPSPTAGAASSEMKDILSRQDYLITFTGTSDAVRQQFPRAVSVSLDIDGHDFPTSEAQLAFVQRFGVLYGQQRDFISLTCHDFSAAARAVGVMDKVTLRIARFGYDAGLPMRVITVAHDYRTRTIRFGLWGGGSGAHTWALGGGNFPSGSGDPGGSQGGPRPVPATGNKDAERDRMGNLSGAFIAAVTTQGPMTDAMGSMTGPIIAGPPPELMIYEGENLAPAETFTGAPAHERTQFMARLAAVTAEDFEGYTPLQSLTGEVLTHNGVSCTITGGASACSDDTLHGRFNTTPSGSQWMDCTASPTDPITLTFSPPVAAMGANMPDFGDFVGQVSVQLTPSGSTADADYRSVVLRLTCDGADLSTSFADASTYARAVTANGNAKVTTTSPKYGTGALALDGTGDYLSIPYAEELSFNGAEFCLEGWARLDTTVASGLTLVDFRGSGSGSSSWQPFVNASTRVIAIWSGTATVLASASNAVPPMGTWFHWAIERQGTTTKIYIDGAQVSSGTYDPAATNASGIRIGLNQAGTNGWIGAMDDIRFTRKVRYGGAFTPPAAALPVEGDPLITINHTVGAANGALYFWGFVDEAQTYTQARFYSSTTEDVFGIDDLVFAPASSILS
jgi:hypothetical protein